MADDYQTPPLPSATIQVHETKPVKLYDAYGRAVRVRPAAGFRPPPPPTRTEGRSWRARKYA